MVKFLHSVRLLSLSILFAPIIVLSQQKLTVSGSVKDSTGVAIDRVTVVIKGTRKRTLTDGKGNFLLTGVPKGASLEFLAEGFKDLVVPVKDAVDFYNIVLPVDFNNIEDITVTTALGFQTKKDKLSVAQSTISAKSIEQSGETSAIDALSSKASGLQIVRSGGDPGASAYIQIRGQSTITGNLQPLIIIDGVPVSNASINIANLTDGVGSDVGGNSIESRLNDLNPDDIADVQVLKGPSAAALWGTQAANGVIYITTKKGKNTGGRINVSVSTTVSIDQMNKTIPYQTNFGQGLGGIYNFPVAGDPGLPFSWGDQISKRKGGQDAYITDPNDPNYQGYVIYPDGSRRYAVASGTSANPSGGKNSKNTYDNFKNMFKTGYFWEQNVVLSGGDDKTVYYASLSNLDQQGIYLAGSDYHRKTVRFNTERKFGKIVKLSGNFNYVNDYSLRSQQGGNVSNPMFGGLRTSPDYDNRYYYGDYVAPNGSVTKGVQTSYRNQLGYAQPTYDNPIWSFNKIQTKSVLNRFFGNIQANFNITSYLELIERAGIDNYANRIQATFPVYSAGSDNPGTGEFSISNVSQTVFNNDIILRGNFKLYKNYLGLTALVGWNFNGNSTNISNTDVYNFIVNTPTDNLGNSGAANRYVVNQEVLIRTSGLYAQLSFTALDQLFLDLTARGDNASTYNGTFYYPSAALSWNFSKIVPTQVRDAFSFGKLRLSYGAVGVQPQPYLQNTLYYPFTINTSGYGDMFDSRAPGFGTLGGYGRSTTLGNPNIKPERKGEFEVGTDLRFWKDKVSLSFTFYENKTTGAILPVAVPASTGFTSQNANAGTIRNRGYEVDLGFNWIQTKDWSFSTQILWSRNRNRVLSLEGTQYVYLNGYSTPNSAAIPGYALGVIYGPDWNRDSKGNIIVNSLGFPSVANGYTVIGDPNPDWIGSISNTIRYKDISLTILIDRVQGGQLINMTRGSMYGYGTHGDVGNMVTATKDLNTFDGRVIKAGTSFRGTIGNFGGGDVALDEAWYSFASGGLGNLSGANSQFVEDATRTRLRALTLTYSLRTREFRKLTKLNAIDFGFTGRNLLLFTPYTGVDPETNLTGPSNGRGIDYYNSPGTRSYVFTIKVSY